MNLGAHQEAAYQAIIDVTIIKIVLIIAMRPDVAMEAMATAMEVMEMEAMETEVIVIQVTMWFEGRIESFV